VIIGYRLIYEVTMDAKRIDVKVFATADSHVEPQALTPVFHGWIQRGAIPNELLIDVADYAHVVDGPGVMLIGHEGQYGYDLTKGRPGLLYSLRRAKIEDGYDAALRYALRQALQAAALLEQEETLKGKLKFDAGDVLVRINDRLLAPNEASTWKKVEPATRAVLGKVFGDGYSVEPAAVGTQELFTLQVRAPVAAGAAALLARLPG
jgi:hypothetical protein